MKAERFKELLDELDGNSLQTLKEKNARYAQNGDCLHNFRSGAEVAGGTPAQACWGYMTKHLVALRDMVERDDFSNREDFLEKCQDTINYIRFLWCIGNDNVSMHMPKPSYDPKVDAVMESGSTCDYTQPQIFTFDSDYGAIKFVDELVSHINNFGVASVYFARAWVGMPTDIEDMEYGWDQTLMIEKGFPITEQLNGYFTVELPIPKKIK